MNYLTLLSLFPKRINVTLIDSETEQLIDKRKILKDELPKVFNRPTVLNIDGEGYQVLKAHPVSGDDFHYTKKLTLHVQKKVEFDKVNTRSLVPTVSGVMPDFCDEPAAMSIRYDEWMQLQFLPASMMDNIKSEINEIGAVLESYNLTGWEKTRIRGQFSFNELKMSRVNLEGLLGRHSEGPLGITNMGSIADSFVLRSPSRCYYGLGVDTVDYLGIIKYDFMDEELLGLMESQGLLLIDWLNMSMIDI